MFWLFWQLVGVGIAVGCIILAIATIRGIAALLRWDDSEIIEEGRRRHRESGIEL